MTIQDLIDNLGGKFGLSTTDIDNEYYLNSRYINGVPLEQVWNAGEESNPYLEEETILETFTNAITPGDKLESKDEEEITDSTNEQSSQSE